MLEVWSQKSVCLKFKCYNAFPNQKVCLYLLTQNYSLMNSIKKYHDISCFVLFPAADFRKAASQFNISLKIQSIKQIALVLVDIFERESQSHPWGLCKFWTQSFSECMYLSTARYIKNIKKSCHMPEMAEISSSQNLFIPGIFSSIWWKIGCLQGT